MVNGSSGESFDAARSSVVLADSNARFVSGAAQLRVLLDWADARKMAETSSECRTGLDVSRVHRGRFDFTRLAASRS